MIKPFQWSSGKRWFAGVSATLVLSVGALILLGLVSAERTRSELFAALDELRLRGAPVHHEDVIAGLAEGDASTIDWFMGFYDFPYPGESGELSAEVKRGFFLAEKRLFESGFTDSSVPEPDEDGEAGSEDSSRFDWSDEILPLIFKGQPPLEEIAPEELAAYGVFMESRGTVHEYALGVAQQGNFDLKGELEDMIARGDGWSQLSPKRRGLIQSYLRCVESLSHGAILAAAEGRSEEAVEQLKLSFQASRLYKNQPWTLGYIVVSTGEAISFHALEVCMAYLPRSVDLSQITEGFRNQDPITELAYALRSERAFVNSTFRDLRELSKDADRDYARDTLPRLVPFVWSRVLDADQLLFLRLMEGIIQECGKSQYDPTRLLEKTVDAELKSMRDIVTKLFLPRGSELHGVALRMQVRRDLALAAAEAHRDGIPEGLRFLEQLRDPFSGKPYHWRVDEGGALVMWSVGLDGTNEEALPRKELDYLTDIVWRYFSHAE
jgi:hypothetical protein